MRGAWKVLSRDRPGRGSVLEASSVQGEELPRRFPQWLYQLSTALGPGTPLLWVGTPGICPLFRWPRDPEPLTEQKVVPAVQGTSPELGWRPPRGCSRGLVSPREGSWTEPGVAFSEPVWKVWLSEFCGIVCART